MLHYKLMQKDCNLPLLDRGSFYNDTDIYHILKFIYLQYSQKINIIRTSYFQKIDRLQELNKLLILKKTMYKEKLKEIETGFNPYMIPELFKLFQNATAEDFKNRDIAHNTICRYIENVNNDLRLINRLKKDFKILIQQYQDINLYYDSKAKITLYDLKQFAKGVITKNIHECMYFYYIKYKKTHCNNLVSNAQFIHSLKTNFENLRLIIIDCINHSFEIKLENTLKNNSEQVYNNLLNKWL